MSKESFRPQATWGNDCEGMRPGTDGKLPDGVVIVRNPKVYKTRREYYEDKTTSRSV